MLFNYTLKLVRQKLNQLVQFQCDHQLVKSFFGKRPILREISKIRRLKQI